MSREEPNASYVTSKGSPYYEYLQSGDCLKLDVRKDRECSTLK